MAEGAENRAEAEDLWGAVQAALTAWHAAHPDASFAAMEAAVEEQVSRVRTELLGERVTAAAEQAGPAHARPVCPDCGTPLQRRGRRARTLTARGGGTLRIERPYYTCPACGSGLFPPG
jgi:ABC-type nitrate/sulfonate/bicarbonate transport system substrate-binding protein